MQFFKLNLEIYPLKDIEKAIEDYSSLVKIKCSLEENAAVLNLDCDEEDFQIIKNEFCNYLIGLIGKYI